MHVSPIRLASRNVRPRSLLPEAIPSPAGFLLIFLAKPVRAALFLRWTVCDLQPSEWSFCFTCNGYLVAKSPFYRAAPPTSDWLAQAAMVGSRGVELFFVISGFILGLPFRRALH